jgi:hypothetical protein
MFRETLRKEFHFSASGHGYTAFIIHHGQRRNISDNLQANKHNESIEAATLSMKLTSVFKQSLSLLHSKARFCYYQTVAVLSLWGVISDEGTGLSFIAVIAVHVIYMQPFCFMSSNRVFVKAITVSSSDSAPLSYVMVC